MSGLKGPPSKRLKTGTDDNALVVGPSDAATNDANNIGVNLDALTVVMSFLAPRELLRLSITCKTLRNAVTTTMVVKSAMIHGGHSKRTMEEIYPLMKNQSIYVPSSQRLLALANGKRCEACNGARRVNFVRPGYGLFLCWEDCLKGRGYSRAWKTTWARFKRNTVAYRQVLFHKQVAGNVYGCIKEKYLITRRLTYGGQPTGPIVCFDDIDRMVAHSAGVEDYLLTKLGAPAKEEYSEFIQAFDGCNERANKEAAERHEKKVKIRARNKEKKNEKAHELVNDLKAMLGDEESSPWRDGATLFYETTPMPSKRQGPIAFTSPYVNSLMAPYILHPSKMRKKLLKEISDKINTKFRLVVDKSFLSFDFLSSKDVFQSRLKSCASRDISSFKALVSTKRVNKEWFQLLQKNRMVEALAHLYGGDLSFVLLSPQLALKYPTFKEEESRCGPAWLFPRSVITFEEKRLFYLAQRIYKSKVRGELAREAAAVGKLDDDRSSEQQDRLLKNEEEEEDCASNKNSSPYIRAFAPSQAAFNDDIAD